jgi:hypothetical protein
LVGRQALFRDVALLVEPWWGWAELGVKAGLEKEGTTVSKPVSSQFQNAPTEIGKLPIPINVIIDNVEASSKKRELQSTSQSTFSQLPPKPIPESSPNL